MKAETSYTVWSLVLLLVVLTALAVLLGGAALEWIFIVKWVRG